LDFSISGWASICISGVSGSGKSTTWINDTLYKAVSHYFTHRADEPVCLKLLKAWIIFDKVINVDCAHRAYRVAPTPRPIRVRFTPNRDGLPAYRNHARGYGAKYVLILT
jgi:excinuclease UvrABC ATPase subunit